MRWLVPILAATALVAAGCGGGEEVRPLPETVIGTVETQPVEKGDAAAGEEVYMAQGCGSCHVFEAAGTTGTIGPDLNTALEGKDAAFVRESIVNPDAELAEGFAAGIMPKTYGTDLSAKQLSDLVAFLTEK